MRASFNQNQHYRALIPSPHGRGKIDPARRGQRSLFRRNEVRQCWPDSADAGLSEHEQGRDEGIKDRPCAIILALANDDGDQRVVVLPVAHSAPTDATEAIEIPPVVKKRLGLDGERSWIILSESNEFTWPGPDLRRVADRDDRSVAYGFLPPKFFNEVRRRFVDLVRTRRTKSVPRTP